MRVVFEHKGDFNKTKRFFDRMRRQEMYRELSRFAAEGQAALEASTPKRTGKTASSWTYEVKIRSGSAEIIWKNTNVNGDVNIALILQTGHGTGTGGYVQGIDYINPVMKPLFDRIEKAVWKVVTSDG